jgi:hypothetical protein
MKKLILTAILFGFGTGLALAEGGGDSNLYAFQTMQQVQSGNYSIQLHQNGE